MQALIPLLNQKNTVLLSEYDVKEMGFQQIALCMAELLMKPGFAALIASEKPESVLSKQGNWVADLRALQYSSSGDFFFLVSHYDGSKIQVPTAQLLDLLNRLEVSAVVLNTANTKPFEAFEHINPARIESEVFAKAHMGAFWDGQYYQDIGSPHHRLDTTTLAEACPCVTCQAPYTKSYLHHLYQHTPLLAERYLAMHNLTSRAQAA